MDIYKHKWTRTQADIFSFLCLRAGESVSQRDIARALRISPTAVAVSLETLKKDSLINVTRTKTINFVSLNRDERQVMELKRVENLRAVYISGLLSYLGTEFLGATITLFGSYSHGSDTTDSDIDIAIIGRKEKTLNLAKFKMLFGRDLNLNFYDSWGNIHRHLRNNILNGIVLMGGVEV